MEVSIGAAVVDLVAAEADVVDLGIEAAVVVAAVLVIGEAAVVEVASATGVDVVEADLVIEGKYSHSTRPFRL